MDNIRRNRENWSRLSAKVHSGRLSGNSDEIYRDGCLEEGGSSLDLCEAVLDSSDPFSA